VRKSVDRRKEYMISQAKKVGRLKDEAIEVFENLEKIGDGPADAKDRKDTYLMEVQVNIKLTSFKSAQKLRSLFVEKLDGSIATVLPLDFAHSRELLEKTRGAVRQHAIQSAKMNARQTAKEMSVKLGHVRFVDDIAFEEHFIHDSEKDSLELKQVQLRNSKTKQISFKIKAAYSILS